MECQQGFFRGLFEQSKKGPWLFLGDLLGMKYFPVLWGFVHKPWSKDPDPY